MPEPEYHHPNRREQPQQRINQINPNRVLHPLNAIIPLRIFFDIHAAKQAKERDPQDEEYRVPDEKERDAREEGDKVEDGGDGGEGADYFGVDPFPIRVFVLLVCGIQIHAIEAADCERED